VAHWVPTDLTKSVNVDVFPAMGVAGYEYPIEPSKHVIFQSVSNFRSINEFYCGLDGTWGGTSLTDDAGAPDFGSSYASAYADNDEFNPYQHVIYADIHNNLTEIYWQSGDKNITDLSASVPGPKAILPIEFAGYAFGGLQNIFFSLPYDIGKASICRLQRFDDEWSFLNLSQIEENISPQGNPLPGSGPGSGPTAFMTTDLPSSIHVLYTGADDGSVNLLTQVNSEGPWTLQSLTTPSPPAVLTVGGLIGASINPRLQAVHYCGFDGHLQQISWIGQTPNSLTYSNLTKPLGAPQVFWGSRPSSYVFPPDRSTHVIYFGQDGHIHELRSTNGFDWTWLDMSIDAGLTDDQAPLALGLHNNVPNFAAFVFTAQLTEHVVFTSVKNHVIELKRGA